MTAWECPDPAYEGQTLQCGQLAAYISPKIPSRISRNPVT